jgi:hypothetical protein
MDRDLAHRLQARAHALRLSTSAVVRLMIAADLDGKPVLAPHPTEAPATISDAAFAAMQAEGATVLAEAQARESARARIGAGTPHTAPSKKHSKA